MCERSSCDLDKGGGRPCRHLHWGKGASHTVVGRNRCFSMSEIAPQQRAAPVLRLLTCSPTARTCLSSVHTAPFSLWLFHELPVLAFSVYLMACHEQPRCRIRDDNTIVQGMTFTSSKPGFHLPIASSSAPAWRS